MKKETVEKRRKEIFDAALTIFSRKGFDKTTLDEIAEEVKISKPALYLYFKNKEVLFFSMVESRMKQFSDNFDSIVQEELSPIEKLREVVTAQVGSFRENREFFRIIHQIKFQVSTGKKQGMQKEFFKKYRKFMNKFTKLIQECIQAGSLREMDPEFMAFTLMGMINQNFFRYLLTNDPSLLQGVDKNILQLFLKGAER